VATLGPDFIEVVRRILIPSYYEQGETSAGQRLGLLATVDNRGLAFDQACSYQRDIVDLLLPFQDIEIGEIADGAGSSPKGDRALRIPKLEVINQQARLK